MSTPPNKMVFEVQLLLEWAFGDCCKSACMTLQDLQRILFAKADVIETHM